MAQIKLGQFLHKTTTAAVTEENPLHVQQSGAIVSKRLKWFEDTADSWSSFGNVRKTVTTLDPEDELDVSMYGNRKIMIVNETSGAMRGIRVRSRQSVDLDFGDNINDEANHEVLSEDISDVPAGATKIIDENDIPQLNDSNITSLQIRMNPDDTSGNNDYCWVIFFGGAK